MSITQLDRHTATEASELSTVPMRFEATTLPVADVDRAKAFYQRLGWRLDIDFSPDEHTRGVAKVSEIWHDVPGTGRRPGIDPERRSYLSRVAFADPDGNTWELQEVTERLPGRV
jgi:catechol 2,3-dioxygenase-like lactoylglutathione lyase family enzyme